MKLYFRECRRIAASLVYFLFLAVLTFSWWGTFRGVTKAEIDAANGTKLEAVGWDRPLLVEPNQEDAYFGMKTSEEHSEEIMTGVTRMLLIEYQKNVYTTYPLPMRTYKAVSLSQKEQARVLEILCEVTGLTKEQLEHLPEHYFPAVTGTIISADRAEDKEDGTFHLSGSNVGDAGGSKKMDKTKRFIPQVTYERFQELMQEMEAMIGEEGSNYQAEMMITYFGLSEKSYEEACAEYDQTIKQDKVTGGFARLFCDYMGLFLGLYPIFLMVFLWLKDRMDTMTELIYSRKISSLKLVFARYLAGITMVLLPVVLLSLESLIPLLFFGKEHRIFMDCFAYIKYIVWWLLPTVMMVFAVGICFTIWTDSPFAILLQLLWWIIDRGATGLSGDTKMTTLMIRHNTLRGYELIREQSSVICINRLFVAGISILLVIFSVWILQQKRKGKINAINLYGKALGNIKSKFSFYDTK